MNCLANGSACDRPRLAELGEFASYRHNFQEYQSHIHSIIENATTDKIVPLVQVPGIRQCWDSRFETAWIIRRFTPLGYEFYSLGNSPPGLGWFINPRDLAGMSQIYVAGNPDGQMGKNEEVVIIQVSIIDKERCSEVRGRTRMKL